MKTNQVLTDIKKSVSKIEVKKRGTSEGDAQRDAFLRRWGIKPQEV